MTSWLFLHIFIMAEARQLKFDCRLILMINSILILELKVFIPSNNISEWCKIERWLRQLSSSWKISNVWSLCNTLFSRVIRKWSWTQALRLWKAHVYCVIWGVGRSQVGQVHWLIFRVLCIPSMMWHYCLGDSKGILNVKLCFIHLQTLSFMGPGPAWSNCAMVQLFHEIINVCLKTGCCRSLLVRCCISAPLKRNNILITSRTCQCFCKSCRCCS